MPFCWMFLEMFFKGDSSNSLPFKIHLLENPRLSEMLIRKTQSFNFDLLFMEKKHSGNA